MVRWIIMVAVMGLLLPAYAFAEVDCSKVPEGMRARCAEAVRVNTACAGLEGEAKSACQQKTINYGATKENCATLTDTDARAKCEQHNRMMSAAAPCSGKVGAELEACIRMNAAKGAVK